MLISWKHRFLFIHIPETGGSSLAPALAPYARQQDKFAGMATSVPGLRGALSVFTGGGRDVMEGLTGFQTHARLEHVNEKLGEARMRPLRKIAFVRNPYTYAYALFKRERGVPGLSVGAGGAFEEFAAGLARNGAGLQTRYLRRADNAPTEMDFIGRYEHLALDTAHLGVYLRLPRPLELNRRDASSEDAPDTQVLQAAFGDALPAFTEAFREDFERLGYSVDILRAHDAPAHVWGPVKRP